jgi:hypothetical protein
VRPGDDELCGDDRSDAGLVEQRRGERAHVREEFALELVGFECCRLHTPGETAQYEPGGELVGGRVRAPEPTAAVEQSTRRQAAQLLTERLGCGDDHRSELAECFPAHVDGAATGDEQEP